MKSSTGSNQAIGINKSGKAIPEVLPIKRLVAPLWTFRTPVYLIIVSLIVSDCEWMKIAIP